MSAMPRVCSQMMAACDDDGRAAESPLREREALACHAIHDSLDRTRDDRSSSRFDSDLNLRLSSTAIALTAPTIPLAAKHGAAALFALAATAQARIDRRPRLHRDGQALASSSCRAYAAMPTTQSSWQL